MEREHCTIFLGHTLRRAALEIAIEHDISLGQVVRNALAREIARQTKCAKPPVRADEQLIAPLRARLAPDLAHASGWQDLDQRLKEKGYVLRVAGGGLALHDWPGDRRVCKASELGFSYSKIMRRFRTPFPNHPHRWLEHRMLGQQPEDDDIIVLEPFEA